MQRDWLPNYAFWRGLLFALHLCVILNFDYLGECLHWGNRGRVVSIHLGWKPPLLTPGTSLVKEAPPMTLKSFITPGKPQFPHLFCHRIVQLLVVIFSLRWIKVLSPCRSHGSTDTLPLLRGRGGISVKNMPLISVVIKNTCYKNLKLYTNNP